ncbi:universal stress protein [Sulfuracidifex tepidarius]|uniref:Universal stress protein n=1 Tax=Sulfuracidifex tepidarius TaxID=1294262 RepID=A0A510DSH2_9CREN|nr:universal stress protein [Sulfuracidifex tepidarius]BBG23105.1 Universal stress protein [Sulfuracidifex tepidarius]BBG25853.1 Universal stress protein [Sulfuracidifex tepidarius]
MFRRILVGFDGSSQSVKALEMALALAKLHGSKVKVVEAIPATHPSGLYLLKEELKEKERILRNRELTRQKAEETRVEVEYVPLRGEPGYVISRVAEEEDFDLVVVGNRGLRGFKKLFSESVSSSVIENSRRNVLVVKT